MELTVYSRSNNHELWLKMREFIPAHIECIEVTGFDHWRDASDYLFHIIENAKTNFIVNIDIDAFVLDWKSIEALAKHMENNNISCSGMPDSADYCPHRSGPPSSLNPFFNIFNAYMLKDMLDGRKDQTEWFQAKKNIPEGSFKFNGDYFWGVQIKNSEPFHGFFNVINDITSVLKLKTIMHYDGVANMLLNHKDEEILIHTWYSREYGVNPEQTERIDYFYEQAKRMQTK